MGRMIVRSGKYKFDFWDLYFAFIIAMPYDVFSVTSFIILEQPASIQYYRVSSLYFSVLFIPFIIYALLNCLRKHTYIIIRPFLLLFLLATKDLVGYLLGCFTEPDFFWFSTYGNYLLASLYFVAVAIHYRRNIDKFLKLYTVVNVATLIFAIIRGVGQEVLSGRSHMSALQHGETAVVLSILTVYFAFKSKDRVEWWVLIFGCILIISTGNRKDIGFIFICLIIFWIRKKRMVLKKVVSKKNFMIFFAGAVVFVIGIITIGEQLSHMMSLNRYTDMILSILNNGLGGFVLSDDSFIGRLESIKAGISVIGDHPILGGMFSLINCQQNMQRYGYPTFPHSTVLYLYCVMGIVAIIPIIAYVKTGISLIKMNDPLQYTFIYIFIRDTISGGANEAIKYLLLMMIVLNTGCLVIRSNRDATKIM